MGGLINPSTGRVTLQQKDPSASLFGMVFQDHSVFPWKTVKNNVRFALDVPRRGTRAERKERVAYWLEQLGLADFADAYPRTLSGGMRQRVSIARALVIEPEILLMDEPFASLDAQLRLILQAELLRVWEAHRRTVVFITHALDEAILLGDRVVVLTARPGQIVDDVRVPFPRPRDSSLRGTPEFAALEHQIWEVLREQVEASSPGRAQEAHDDATEA
jgi:NitT/TauT family transport system ATP-binding protein